MRRPDNQCGAFSLIEAAFASALVGIFFVGLFGLNSQCLYLVNSSRELMVAGQTIQSRLEQVRNCKWSQLTDPNYIKNTVLNTGISGASSLGTITEVVTINKYQIPVPSPSPTPIQVTRAGNGTVTINSTNSTIAAGDMATINVLLSWSAAPGARARSISVSTTWAEAVR